MGLNSKEAAKHAPKVIALIDELRAALDPDGPGGKKVTGRELRRIIGRLLPALGALLVDAID